MSKFVLVRVLSHLILEGQEYRPNALVEFDADRAAKLKDDGSADDDKSAVEYVKKELLIKPVKHVPVETTEEPKA